MQSIVIKDNKERILLKAKGGRCVIARYEDLNKEMKKDIATMYSEITGNDVNSVMKFLNFESEVQEFCS